MNNDTHWYKSHAAEIKKKTRCAVSLIALEYAIPILGYSESTTHIYQNEYPRIIKEAKRLEVALVTDRAKPIPDRHLPFIIRPSDRVRSDRYCDEFEPDVCAIRKDLFGSSKIPFRSAMEARAWINATAKEERDEREMAEPASIQRQISALAAKTGLLVDVRSAILAYPLKMRKDQNSHVVHVGICADGKLAKIAAFAQRVALTGFHRAAVTWWVLLDIRPVVPRLRINRQLIGDRTGVTLEVNAPDVTWKEWCDFYRSIRPVVSTKRQVPARHIRILELVTKHGGPPRNNGTKTQFWKRILYDLWKAEERRPPKGGRKMPTTWHAVRKAYYALKK